MRLYLDTCNSNTCIDIGIDLTTLQSIVHRYRFTKKLSVAPISVHNHKTLQHFKLKCV